MLTQQRVLEEIMCEGLRTLRKLRREVKYRRKHKIIRARWVLSGMISGGILLYAVMRFVYEVPPAVQDELMGLRP